MRSFRALALAAALACAAPSALAQAPSPLATSPIAPPPVALPQPEGTSQVAADHPAGAYTLDPAHASVIWRVRHNSVGLFTARFDRIAGALTFDPQNPTASTITASVDAASVSTGVRNAAGALAFDGEVARALGAETTPQITFTSRRAERLDAAAGLIEGDLTLNGVTRPVTLQVTFHGGRFVQIRQKHVLGFAARGVIRRSDFGVTRWAPFVGDEVEILIDAEFIKA
ncbi:MAG: YceI family protein [Hyphomonadaceae bacterium]|nr:YceI family protein [Hyphomonadaceae bacterium]